MSACNVSILPPVSWPRMPYRWCRSRNTPHAAPALSSSSAVRSRRFGISPLLVRSGRHRPTSSLGTPCPVLERLPVSAAQHDVQQGGSVVMIDLRAADESGDKEASALTLAMNDRQ